MGRKVRHVRKDWNHPRDEDGHYIPLHDRDFAREDAEWSKERAKWIEGFARSYSKGGPEWEPIDPKYRDMRFTDYSGPRPNPDDYMPDWPEAERTHFQMYEDTSEGTPISPVMESPESLAQWLVDNKASAFGGMTATYEQWLRVCRGAYAPSAVMDQNGIRSGVEAMGDAVEVPQ